VLRTEAQETGALRCETPDTLAKILELAEATAAEKA